MMLLLTAIFLTFHKWGISDHFLEIKSQGKEKKGFLLRKDDEDLCIYTNNQLYTRSLQTDQETYDMPWIYVQLIMFWLNTQDNRCNNFSENFTLEILRLKYSFGVQVHARARLIKKLIRRKIKLEMSKWAAEVLVIWHKV